MLRLIISGAMALSSGLFVANNIAPHQLALVPGATTTANSLIISASFATTTTSTSAPTQTTTITNTIQTIAPVSTYTATCSEAVRQLFLTLLHREPDIQGCIYWSSYFTLAEAEAGIRLSDEYLDLTTPTYTVTVCNGTTWTTCPLGQKLHCPPVGTGTGMCVDERVSIDYAPPTDTETGDNAGTGGDTGGGYGSDPTDFPDDFVDGNLLPELKITSFVASPSVLFWGNDARLTWSSENATSCVSDSFDTAGATSNNEGVLVSPSGSFSDITYTIFCHDELNRQVSADVTITKIFRTAPSITTFVAIPTKVATGEASTLSWTSDSTTSCTSEDFQTDGAANNEVGRVVNPVETTTYTITCHGKNMFGFNTSVDREVTVTVVPSLCPYVALTISETKTTDLAHPVAFSLLDVSRHDEDISSGISPYFEEDGATYILKVFNKSASTTPKQFALDSSRFAIFENFSETEPSGEIVEFDSGTISTVIPYDGSVTGIQVDDGEVIPLNPAILSCVRSCRLENESVELGSQICCGALKPQEVGYTNTFTCLK